MRISGGAFHVRQHTLVAGRGPGSSGPSRSTLRTQLRRVDEEVTDLRRVLEQIRGHARSGLAPSVLGHGLGLGDSSAAALESSEEVNTEATRLSSRSPQWSGPGGRDVSIGGVYSGADDDVLTFTVASSNGRKIDITDSGGALVDTINLNASGDEVTKTLADGLTLTLAAGGALTQGDSFTLEVFASQDGAIDPDDAFNGVGDASARFEQGTVISDGSFQVNGATIDVFASDSLNDVLARVNATVDGVTATYDAGTEKVRFTTDASGADETLEITGDSSGLIAALKLDGLGQATGTGADASSSDPMATLPGFEGVTAGTISVNGQTITIDPAIQSLDDVLSLIGDVEGVEAYLDPLGRVRIVGETGSQLTLTDGGSGFFDAIGADTGAFAGREPTGRRLSDFSAQRVAREVGQLREALDDLADNGGLTGLAAQLRTDVAGAIESALEDSEGLNDVVEFTRFGDFANDKLASRSRQRRAIRGAYGEFREVMLGDRSGGDEGLLDRLEEIVDDGLRGVGRLDVSV